MSCSRSSVSCACQYESSGAFFGVQKFEPQLKWEQDLNQALWQAAFYSVTSKEKTPFKLGAERRFGEWLDPADRLRLDTQLLDELRSVKGFPIPRPGFLKVKAARSPNGSYELSFLTDSFDAGAKKVLLDAFRTIFSDARFTNPPSNDNLIIFVAANNEPVPAVPPPDLEQCKLKLAKFRELFSTGQKKLQTGKLLPDQSVELVMKLSALDQDVNNFSPAPYRLPLTEYQAIKELLLGILPLVKQSKALFLGQAPLTVPYYYSIHGAYDESVSLQQIVLNAIARNPEDFAAIQNSLHYMLQWCLSASEKNKLEYSKSCGLVYDVIKNWKANPAKGILPLGSDFDSLKLRSSRLAAPTGKLGR